jgi:hypothetical protein
MSQSSNNATGPLVILIAGAGRSGSTLLGNALGEMSGCFHGGEVSFLMGQFDEGNNICGCGRSISECARESDTPPRWCPRICGCGNLLQECELWQPVQSQVFNTESSSDDLVELGRFSVSGMSYRPGSLLRLRRQARNTLPTGSSAERYGEALRRIYLAIADATGAEVVIDSSKRAMHVYLGARVTGMRTHVVHLVRDPRAIAYSWRGRRDGVTLTPSRSSVNWAASNLATEALHRRSFGSRYSFLRYESFIRDPMVTLEELGRQIGIPDRTLPFVDPTTLHMSTNHSIAGSPSRFVHGDVKLVPDDEWKLKMRFRDRMLATIPTVPFLRHYGYRIINQ